MPGESSSHPGGGDSQDLERDRGGWGVTVNRGSHMCEQYQCERGAGPGAVPLRVSASLNLCPRCLSCPTLIQALTGRVELRQEEF